MSNLFRRSIHQRQSSTFSTTTKKITDIGGKLNSDLSSLYGLRSISFGERLTKKRNQDFYKTTLSVEAPTQENSHPNIENSSAEIQNHQESAYGTECSNFEESPNTMNTRNKSRSGTDEIMDSEKNRTRRERTFVGSECAVCEEPLEHTLRGERILQFSCGHVSHEACFYEHIKEFGSQYCPMCNAPLGLDTSRGSNVLDIEKLSNIVRSVANESPKLQSNWDGQPARPSSRESYNKSHQRTSRSREAHENKDRAIRYSSSKMGHTRQISDLTHSPSDAYSETVVSENHGRLEYEHQISELDTTSPASSLPRNPIPPPTVTVRSEFPTLNRSREQQTLTCIISVEVIDNNWLLNQQDLCRSSSPGPTAEEAFTRPPSPAHSAPKVYPYESPEVLSEITENLRLRVENWHGLDFSRFGDLRLYGKIRVGKDKISWQELECFLFAEMLVCVKEKKVALPPHWGVSNQIQKATRCTLKGSILIKRHLNEVINMSSGDENVLTLSLSVAELPSFHLKFESKNQLKLWQHALLGLNTIEEEHKSPNADYEAPDQEEEDWQRVTDEIIPTRNPSTSSCGVYKPNSKVASPYPTASRSLRPPANTHVPLDIVVVVPISSSMQGVKINLVRDSLMFIIQNLGERDRLGVVTFGSGSGATPLVGLRKSGWNGWSEALSSIRPVGQKSPRSDVVEGANIAMDLLMQRKSSNPIATILLISDSSTFDQEAVDFVVSRAEAAKITIFTFGLGLTHKPDTMFELSTRTKASYMYVKDWMMLRECLAGCLGAMQSMSHQNVKLKLHLPEGSPAKFVKISGALQTTKRATGRDAEALLGDLRFGDKRDILVQLVILPDPNSQEQIPQDPWESIVSGLEALGGPSEKEDERIASVEEVPLIQADLSWGDILRDSTLSHLPRPSLLAITMLPAPTSQEQKNSSWSSDSIPIPPHPSVVQRRMELLTSDMLNRALSLVSRGQHDRAQHLLNETRSILKGLGKGGLPPVPSSTVYKPRKNGTSPHNSVISPDSTGSPLSLRTSIQLDSGESISNDISSETNPSEPSGSIGSSIISSLDSELEASLEWIAHPSIFSRDSRKAALQAIGVISSQRGFTFRTQIESFWASRIRGVKKLIERSKEWREEIGGENGILEEI